MRTPWKALILAAALTTRALAVGPPVPAEFVGEWSGDAACKAPLRVRIGTDSVTLVNGDDVQRFGDVDLCFSCAGGARYEGPIVWLVGDYRNGAAGGGVEHFTVYLNQPDVGSTQVEVVRPDLRKRFPFSATATLKKCKAAP